MARTSQRGKASGSNGVKVKAEKTTRSRVQKTESGEEDVGEGSSQHQNGQQANDREDDDEEEDEEEEEEDEGSTRGNKRQRVNANGDSRSSRAPTEEEEDEDERPAQNLPRTQTLPRDVDGFIPGSIVRIQLKNFVTYDYVEFRPGPYLNMIVGPNGTGKSSIACAIALGLNFSPKILGRASELNAFVKNGTDAGYIEIELKGPAGKGNLVIRRSLSGKDRKSSFTLNGQPALGKEVTAKMAELNVQVENLCSFLPQDKVSSFAAMTPQQLLIETQKAAGDPNLSSWFESLKEEGKQLKIAAQKLKDDEAMVKQMRDRNENIERDVERFREREKLEKEIEEYEVFAPLMLYRELRIQYFAAKEEQRIAYQRMMKLKSTNEPAHKLERKLDGDAKKAAEKRDQQKKAMVTKANALKRKQGESDKLDGEAESLMTKLSSLKKNEKDRQRNIKTKEAELEKIREELERPPPNLADPVELNEEHKQINLEKLALSRDTENHNAEMREVVEKKMQAKRAAEDARRQMEKLDTVDAKKLALLRKWDPATHDAVLWLRGNKDKFKMEVLEPPILSVTVKDPNFTALVEAGFPGTQMRTIVAQCKEDLNTLNHYVNDTTQALGRRVQVPTWYRHNVDRLPPPPLNPQEMNDLGFEGYIYDYIEHPQGMEHFLKSELNLHRIAITRNPRIDVGRAMECLGNVGGGVFINGTTFNTVTRSKYGRKAVGNMTRDIGAARNFAVPPVDISEMNRLQAIVQQNEMEMGQADEEKARIQDLLNEATLQDKALRQRIDIVKSRRDAIKREQERIQRFQSKLKKSQSDLEALRNAPSAEEERGKLKKRLMDISKKRIKIARDYTALAEEIYREQIECTNAGLQHAQATCNHAALKALCAIKDEKYTKASAKFAELHEKYKGLKETSHAVLTETRERIGDNEELQEKVRIIEDARTQYDRECAAAKAAGRAAPDPEGVDLRSSDELNVELENRKAQLETMMAANPGVVEEYENRKRSIEQLDRTIENIEEKIRRHNKKIKMHKDQWLPALQKLVDSIGKRFSDAFERIGCAGEIRIREDEDFEQWAIEIYVTFRANEKLQLLTGQRQSGGERSLTTILYLMSLTEEARAPFSLVDEINQGMDQRAERMVHNSMVEVTCKEDSAQYFLITPKLLTDLDYHERMKVLCVNNGEWLPEERSLGNMMNMIEGFVQRNKGSRGAQSA